MDSSVVGNYPLSIGSVNLTIEECPPALPLGGIGAVVKRVKVGGGTNTQKLGARDRDISWDGMFFENARKNHTALLAYNQSQQTVLVTWRVDGIKQYNGIVTEYYSEFHDQSLADYHISLSVTDAQYQSPNPNGSQSVDNVVAGQESDINDSYTTVVALDPGAAAVLPDPADLNVQIQQAGALAQGSGSIQNLQAFLSTAITRIQAYQGSIPALSASQVPAGSMLASYQLMLGNVTNGQTSNSQFFDAGTTSLFRVAAQQTGEPSNAYAIANANGYAFPNLLRGSPSRIGIPPIPGGS